MELLEMTINLVNQIRLIEYEPLIASAFFLAVSTILFFTSLWMFTNGLASFNRKEKKSKLDARYIVSVGFFIFALLLIAFSLSPVSYSVIFSASVFFIWIILTSSIYAYVVRKAVGKFKYRTTNFSISNDPVHSPRKISKLINKGPDNDAIKIERKKYGTHLGGGA